MNGRLWNRGWMSFRRGWRRRVNSMGRIRLRVKLRRRLGFRGRIGEYDNIPQRDERFPDPYNMGVHAEEFLYDEKFDERDKVLMMFYKRIREIDVPEMMAPIMVELMNATGNEEKGGRPWAFYRDLTRQMWDEARHAMMGEVGFAKLGLDWPKLVMVNFTWSKGLNEQLTPTERHAVLWFIEQGLMNKTGKRFEWEGRQGLWRCLFGIDSGF